jgi:hypothetical protein
MHLQDLSKCSSVKKHHSSEDREARRIDEDRIWVAFGIWTDLGEEEMVVTFWAVKELRNSAFIQKKHFQLRVISPNKTFFII